MRPTACSRRDIGAFYIRASDGEMTPYSAFATLSWSLAPMELNRYNGLSAMEIQGAPVPGVSNRRGDGRDGSDPRQDAAGHRARMDGPVL